MTDPTSRAIAANAAVLRHQATIMRVADLANQWSQRPCITGYRLHDDNDSDSECLHCASAVLRATLTGEAAS